MIDLRWVCGASRYLWPTSRAWSRRVAIRWI